MADIQTSQTALQVVAKNPASSSITLSQSFQQVILNFPSPELQSSAVSLLAIFDAGNDILVSQVYGMVVGRGRIENPKLKTWKFILDDHEIVVFRVGEDKTLIYDVTTSQWAWWDSLGRNTWRANTGLNWADPGPVPRKYGSNVVVGDADTGILWILDPEQGWDDSARQGDEDPVFFRRRATAQGITRGREFIPVYDVFLTGSPGHPATLGQSVTLNYSDDGGKTFVNAGDIEVNLEDFTQEFAWRSLGRIQAPGRIFQIFDDGAFTRIDGLDINTKGNEGAR